MKNKRLEYLLNKCRLQIAKKRYPQARVWLEIGLDEFPYNRELQRVAGILYLNLGMTEKAISFIEYSPDINNSEIEKTSNYDHNEITQKDIDYLQEKIKNNPSSVAPSLLNNKQDESIDRKTLSLKKDKIRTNIKNINTEFVCTDRLGIKNISIKKIKKESKQEELKIYTDKKPTSNLQEHSIYNVLKNDLLHNNYNKTPSSNNETITIYENENSTADTIDDYSLEYNSSSKVSITVEDKEYTINDADGEYSFDDEYAFDDLFVESYSEENDLYNIADDVLMTSFDFDVIDDVIANEKKSFQNISDEDGKLSRWERAQQIAIEVIYNTNWPGKNLSFLTEIFFENGWGAARVVIEKEIINGTTIDELILAREFKDIWKNCDRYWITMYKLGSLNQITDATHKQMSWSQALKIIRCFNWTPSIEELEVFLDDEFEYWYQHSIMRKAFPVFMKYLCYYRATKDTLDFEIGPYHKSISIDPLDEHDISNCNSNYNQKLHKLGVKSLFND